MTDRSGQLLGNYRLLRLLGTGGFAEVYLGEHRSLATQAALKILNTRLANAEQAEQFSREAYLIAHLVHPYIVRVFDFGVEGETPFLIMDYAPHGTLRQQYPHGTILPLVNILPYVRQVAAALQYAHEHQLIHRDVKPENLLLGRQGEIWLSDFGISVLAPESRSLTTQNVVGTVAYMAPEQLRGKPRPASDQYGLAIIVYEWLAGRCPFTGTALEVATQHLLTPPASLQQVGVGIPAQVEEVVRRALAKDPQARFASVQAFATALERASRGEAPLRAARSSAWPTASLLHPLPLEDASLQPTTVLPERPTQPAPEAASPPARSSVSKERQDTGVPEECITFGEQVTLPEDEPANQQFMPGGGASRRPPAHRRKQRLLAAVLLLVVLGGTLLAVAARWAGAGARGVSATATSTVLAQSSSPGVDQTPQPGASPTGSGVSTPTGTRPTVGPGVTPTTGSGTTPTVGPGPTPTPTVLPAHLSVSPLTMTFNLQVLNCLIKTHTQLLTVQNTGAAGLDWQATIQDSTYLTISQSSGHLGAGQMLQVKVSAVCLSFTVQTTDQITVTSNGGTMVVTVTINLL